MKNYKPLLLLIFPLFWVILSYFETGSLLGFIHSVSSRKRIMRTEDIVFYNFLQMALTSGMILGLVYLKKNRNYLWIFISTLVIWTIATSLTGAMATHNVWRVGTIWNVLLIPFVAYLVWQLYSHQKVMAMILMFGLIYLSALSTINHSKESYTKIEDLEAGKFISTLDNILMPRYQWEYSNLMLFNPKIVALDKITDVKGYNYLILTQQVNLPLVYRNKKWFVYKIKEWCGI